VGGKEMLEVKDYTGKIKGIEREERRASRQHGMGVSGRSLKTVVAPAYAKRNPGTVHLLSWADGATDAQHCACGKVVYNYFQVTIYPSKVTCEGCKK